MSSASALPRGEADLLQQHADLEQVGHRLALRDHVVRDRLAPEAPMDVRGCLEDRELRARALAVGRKRGAQQPRRRELAQQQGDAGVLAEREIVDLDAGDAQQLGDRGLVNVGVLPQVERRQVEAERAQREAQRREPVAGERRGAVGGERSADDREVGVEGLGRRVGRQLGVRRTRGDVARDLARGRGKPRIDARQRLPVGLVLAVRVGIARTLGECQQRLGRPHEARRHRQLGAECVHLVEVGAERERTLRARGVTERLGRHERIAVAVAADPAAHAEERRHLVACEGPVGFADRGRYRTVEPRHLGEEGRAIEVEAVLDLVDHPQARQAQHRGLPEREHVPADRRLELALLLLGERRAVARVQRPRDRALGVLDALALDLGRMRGEHRAHRRSREPGARRPRGRRRSPRAGRARGRGCRAAAGSPTARARDGAGSGARPRRCWRGARSS